MKNKIKTALKKIKRYNIGQGEMARSGRGRWVKYEDMMDTVIQAVTDALNEKHHDPSTNDDKPFDPGERINQ